MNEDVDSEEEHVKVEGNLAFFKLENRNGLNLSIFMCNVESLQKNGTHSRT